MNQFMSEKEKEEIKETRRSPAHPDQAEEEGGGKLLKPVSGKGFPASWKSHCCQ